MSEDEEEEDDEAEESEKTDENSDVEEKTELESKKPERSIPEAWHCKMDNVHVGDFVVLEVTYTACKEREITVSQVKTD